MTPDQMSQGCDSHNKGEVVKRKSCQTRKFANEPNLRQILDMHLDARVNAVYRSDIALSTSFAPEHSVVA